MTHIPKEDWWWLTDVHKVDTTDAVVIVLHGSEDSPSKVEVYDRDHYQAIPVREYITGPDGDLMLNPPEFMPKGFYITEAEFFKLWELEHWLLHVADYEGSASKLHSVLHAAVHATSPK